jgi:hypothetical protein
MRPPTELDRKREDKAIALIEAQGIEHLYTYNPDDVARRYVFKGDRTIIGLTSLEKYAGIGKRLMYVDLEGLSIVLGSARLRKLQDEGYIVEP